MYLALNSTNYAAVNKTEILHFRCTLESGKAKHKPMKHVIYMSMQEKHGFDCLKDSSFKLTFKY